MPYRQPKIELETTDKMQDITPFAGLLPIVELWNRLQLPQIVVQLYKQATGPSRGVGGTEENADLIHEAPRWYPSLLVFRKKLAGAAAIPGGSLPAAARFACGPISLGIAAWGL